MRLEQKSYQSSRVPGSIYVRGNLFVEFIFCNTILVALPERSIIGKPQMLRSMGDLNDLLNEFF